MATFLFTLVLCAAGLVAYAFYVTSHSIEDPNIQDWNSFMANFDTIEFCLDSSSVVKSPQSLHNISQIVKVNLDSHKNEDDQAQIKALRDSYMQSSVCLMVETTLSPSKVVNDNTTLLQNVDHVLFRVNAKSFGIQGETGKSSIFGYLQLPALNAHLKCDADKTSPQAAVSNEQCHLNKHAGKSYTKLLLLTNRTNVLPHYKKRPTPCYEDTVLGKEQTEKLKTEALDILLNGKIESQTKQLNTVYVPRRHSNSSCGKGPQSFFSATTRRPPTGEADTTVVSAEYYVVDILHKFDIDLTAFLSVGDQHMINIHLVHTSYFLLLMVALLIVFSLVRCNQHTSSPTSSPHYKQKTSSETEDEVMTAKGLAVKHPQNRGKNAFVLLQNDDEMDSDLDA